MFTIRNKEDARRFVKEFGQIKPTGEGYHLSMPIAYSDTNERVRDVKTLLHYSPGSNTFRIEEFIEVQEDIASETKVMYEPAVVELAWTCRKIINQELRKIAIQKKGGVA